MEVETVLAKIRKLIRFARRMGERCAVRVVNSDELIVKAENQIGFIMTEPVADGDVYFLLDLFDMSTYVDDLSLNVFAKNSRSSRKGRYIGKIPKTDIFLYECDDGSLVFGAAESYCTLDSSSEYVECDANFLRKFLKALEKSYG